MVAKSTITSTISLGISMVYFSDNIQTASSASAAYSREMEKPGPSKNFRTLEQEQIPGNITTRKDQSLSALSTGDGRNLFTRQEETTKVMGETVRVSRKHQKALTLFLFFYLHPYPFCSAINAAHCFP